MISQRELELQIVTSLKGSPNTLVRKYMKLFDEKAEMEILNSELENQIAAMSDMLCKAETKQKEQAEENAKLNRSVIDYETMVRDLTIGLEQLREEYSGAVAALREKEKIITNLEIKDAELSDKAESLEKSLSDAMETIEKTQEELREAQDCCEILGNELEKKGGQNLLGKIYRFGSRSERTSNILGGHAAQEDPIDEGSPCNEEAADEGGKGTGRSKPTSAEKATARIDEVLNGKKGNGENDDEGDDKEKRDSKKGKKRKKRGAAAAYTDPFEKYKDLQQVENYEYDDENENSDEWERMGYEYGWKLEQTKPVLYVRHTYRAKYKKKATRQSDVSFYTVPYTSNCFPGSYCGSSIFASLVIQHFVQGVTTYALEEHYKMSGIDLSRKTIDKWFLHFSEVIFSLVCAEMERQLNTLYSVWNMDETYITQVVWDILDKMEGKHNGSKAIIWNRASGELSEGPTICIYAYCKSRSAQYLRDSILGLAGTIISDAYQAYVTIETESNGLIKVSMCWMHLRRYFAEAVTILDEDLKKLDVMTEEEILGHPAVKGLLMLNDVFKEDKKLKHSCKTAAVRKEKRLEKVAPLVDAFFGYIRDIDLEGDGIYDKLKQAIGYALHNEDHLRNFLTDGEIPIDNGNSERYIKYVAKVRKASLFAYTEVGGECLANCLTITRTAIANGADPYLYVKFLIEEVPKYLNGTDLSFLADMMPWGSSFLLWAKRQTENHVDESVPRSTEPRDQKRFHIKGRPRLVDGVQMASSSPAKTGAA